MSVEDEICLMVGKCFIFTVAILAILACIFGIIAGIYELTNDTGCKCTTIVTRNKWSDHNENEKD